MQRIEKEQIIRQITNRKNTVDVVTDITQEELANVDALWAEYSLYIIADAKKRGIARCNYRRFYWNWSWENTLSRITPN